MNIAAILKKNKLLGGIASIYLMLLIFKPNHASEALGNSVYYLIEMFQVLPVIFLLTVAIDVLIPKNVIIKRFGEKSGIMGNILALLLGSVSAGPIYAAFPIGKMLLSKGASVSNIVIIISSWAVVKIPMLANEVKFLGADFMVVRWVLTVVFIFLMGWIMEKTIDRESLAIEASAFDSNIPIVKAEFCVGCGICASYDPNIFVLEHKKAVVRVQHISTENEGNILMAVEKCPTSAIIYKNGEK